MEISHALLARLGHQTQNTRIPNILPPLIKQSQLSVDDILPSNKEYDLVYILKPSEKNWDLRYSLRSVEKFCKYKNIWFIGYKPTWSQNVKHIATIQNKDKWKNSMLNYKTACECPYISDNFILMNDDFFAIEPIIDWKENLNVCLGKIEDEVEKYKDNIKKSKWRYAFDYAQTLLRDLKCPTTWNYETHLPIIINKQKFLEMLNMPEIIEFQETNKVLHKRSIYKNLFPDVDMPTPRIINDVKITLKFDLSQKWLEESWLSVFDDVTNNIVRYPKLNAFLIKNFPTKSKYEK